MKIIQFLNNKSCYRESHRQYHKKNHNILITLTTFISIMFFVVPAFLKGQEFFSFSVGNEQLVEVVDGTLGFDERNLSGSDNELTDNASTAKTYSTSAIGDVESQNESHNKLDNSKIDVRSQQEKDKGDSSSSLPLALAGIAGVAGVALTSGKNKNRITTNKVSDSNVLMVENSKYTSDIVTNDASNGRSSSAAEFLTEDNTYDNFVSVENQDNVGVTDSSDFITIKDSIEAPESIVVTDNFGVYDSANYENISFDSQPADQTEFEDVTFTDEAVNQTDINSGVVNDYENTLNSGLSTADELNNQEDFTNIESTNSSDLITTTVAADGSKTFNIRRDIENGLSESVVGEISELTPIDKSINNISFKSNDASIEPSSEIYKTTVYENSDSTTQLTYFEEVSAPIGNTIQTFQNELNGSGNYQPIEQQEHIVVDDAKPNIPLEKALQEQDMNIVSQTDENDINKMLSNFEKESNILAQDNSQKQIYKNVSSTSNGNNNVENTIKTVVDSNNVVSKTEISKTYVEGAVPVIKTIVESGVASNSVPLSSTVFTNSTNVQLPTVSPNTSLPEITSKPSLSDISQLSSNKPVSEFKLNNSLESTSKSTFNNVSGRNGVNLSANNPQSNNVSLNSSGNNNTNVTNTGNTSNSNSLNINGNNAKIQNNISIGNVEPNANNLNGLKEAFIGLQNTGRFDYRKIKKITKEMLDNLDETVKGFKSYGDMRSVDDYTYRHSLAVAKLSIIMGREMGFSIEKIKLICEAALVHDIGKKSITEEILYKPGKLSSAEFERMKNHAIYGYHILNIIPEVDDVVKLVALQHHEKGDGSGYPQGLVLAETSEFAKIIVINDIFDALASKRVYKDGMCPFQVLKQLTNEKEGVFDSRILDLFVNVISKSLVGKHVMLSTGEEAEVISINRGFVDRPVVLTPYRCIDLSDELAITIKNIIEE